MALRDLDPEMQAKLIERIKALFALGDKSRNNSEEEANVAVKKAHEILQKYNLSMSEVMTTKETIAEDIVDECSTVIKKSTLSSWVKTLLNVVGICCECKPYYHWDRSRFYNENTGRMGMKTTYQMRFIGTPWDVAIAKELFDYLYKTLNKLSSSKYPENLSDQTSYLEGALYRLMQRVREQNEQFKQEQVSNQKYALMVVNKKDAIDLWAKSHLNLTSTERKSRDYGYNPEAYAAGVRDANKIDLGTKNRIKGSEQEINRLE